MKTFNQHLVRVMAKSGVSPSIIQRFFYEAAVSMLKERAEEYGHGDQQHQRAATEGVAQAKREDMVRRSNQQARESSIPGNNPVIEVKDFKKRIR